MLRPVLSGGQREEPQGPGAAAGRLQHFPATASCNWLADTPELRRACGIGPP